MTVKFSKAQARVFASLPLSLDAWNQMVASSTRDCLLRRGLANVVPGGTEEAPTFTVQPRWKKLPPAYLALRAKAQEIGWPTRFRCDLASDRDSIMAWKPIKFAWILRESGTHLYPAEADPYDCIQQIIDIAQIMSGVHRYFFWNGGVLTEHSATKVGELLQEANDAYVEKRGTNLDLSDAEIRRVVSRQYFVEPDAKVLWPEPNKLAKIWFSNRYDGFFINVRRRSTGKLDVFTTNR